MRIDRAAHLPWIMFVAVATALASLFYAAKYHPQLVPAGVRFFGEAAPEPATMGGTPLGLLFGALALGIFIFAALLGLRKKLPWLRIGNVQRWLRAHIWLTLLTVPLVLLHSGFRLGGPMTALLMVLYAVVMLSGVYGVILQHRLPVMMKERLPAEIVYEQIPYIRERLCTAAEALQKSFNRAPPAEAKLPAPTAVAAAAIPDVSAHAVLKTPSGAEKGASAATIRGTRLSPAAILVAPMSEDAGQGPATDPASEAVLSTFIETRLLPYLRARRGEKYRLGHAREAEDTFRQLKLRVAEPYRVRVTEIQGW
ncbi:MAG TPA: hypothetical protein VF683_09340, partial [Chthoniobacterales bacterium]